MANRDEWSARLSEYVDGDLPATERVDLEAHVRECPDCGRTIEALRRVRDAATRLPGRPPTRDLWPGIAARIGAHPGALVRPLRRRWTFTLPQLAAAAVLLLAVGAAGAVVLLHAPGTAPASGAAVAAPAASVAAAYAASPAYRAAEADLAAVLAAHRASLDTATVRVLEETLATIDRAIARARAALEADPSDPYLNAHLAETMRRKLTVMRRAAALVARS